MLSIIVPAGLLTAAEFAGVIGPLPVAETIRLETAGFTFFRPTDTSNLNKDINRSYGDEEISLMASFILGYYDTRYDSLSIGMKVDASVLLSGGFIENINVLFEQDNNESTISLSVMNSGLENLSLIIYQYGNPAFIRLGRVHYPRHVQFRGYGYWDLYYLVSGNQTRWLEAIYEVAYFNGTAYKKIVQPFNLTMGVGYHYLDIAVPSHGTTNPMPGTHTYIDGADVNVMAIPDSGYAFDHWDFDGGVFLHNPLNVIMWSDHDLTVTFKKIYILTITSGDGGTTGPPSGIYEYKAGATVWVTAFAHAGYAFDHWIIDGAIAYNSSMTVTMNSDHNLRAYFVKL
jgi:hypothetical protein